MLISSVVCSSTTAPAAESTPAENDTTAETPATNGTTETPAAEETKTETETKTEEGETKAEEEAKPTEEEEAKSKMTGRVMIVTGASSGLGFGVANYLCEGGNDVILACRNEDKANHAIEKIKAKNPNALATYMNVSIELLLSGAEFDCLRDKLISCFNTKCSIPSLQSWGNKVKSCILHNIVETVQYSWCVENDVTSPLELRCVIAAQSWDVLLGA